MNGFCMQQTDSPFVCCIVDDASIDGEQDVINQYLADHFDLADTTAFKRENDYAYITYAQHKENTNCYFAVLLLKENLYSKTEGYKKMQYISEWRDNSEYEAICEGDDYWISPSKLSNQCKILDNNSDVGMCYTLAKIMKNDKVVGISGTDDTSFEGLLSYSNFPTLTRVYRLSLYKSYVEDIKPIEKGWKMGDYPFAFYCVLNSKIFYDSDITAVYRVLSESASHNKNVDFLINFYDNADEVRKYFIENAIADNTEKNQYNHIIKKNEVKYKIKTWLSHKDIASARKYLSENNEYLSSADKMLFDILIRTPFLIKFLRRIKK